MKLSYDKIILIILGIISILQILHSLLYHNIYFVLIYLIVFISSIVVTNKFLISLVISIIASNIYNLFFYKLKEPIGCEEGGGKEAVIEAGGDISTGYCQTLQDVGLIGGLLDFKSIEECNTTVGGEFTNAINTLIPE